LGQRPGGFQIRCRDEDDGRFRGGLHGWIVLPGAGRPPEKRGRCWGSRGICLRRHAPDNFKRADDNLLASRMMAVEMIAMAKDVFTVLGGGHEAHCGFIDAPQGAGPACLREGWMRLRITRRSLGFRFVVCSWHVIT
jgi:hypothetical protein